MNLKDMEEREVEKVENKQSQRDAYAHEIVADYEKDKFHQLSL
jgi:hypothetical protein